MKRDHVQCPTVCELCNRENEDTWHVLFEWEMSKNGRYNSAACFQRCKMIWLIWNKESMALESREERCNTIGCSSISYLDGWYKGAQKFNNNNRNITKTRLTQM
ncbi:hypothetical protein QL285_012727 [Trifolium repens]|nr:hypothetical protein QL285_012727 [Trifolium repens]